MQQNGQYYPGNSALYPPTQTITTSTSPGGLGDAMTAGAALAQMAGDARQLGSDFSLHDERISGGAPNMGIAVAEGMGAGPIDVSQARSSQMVENESGGEFDHSSHVYTMVPYNINASESTNLSQRTHLENGDYVWIDTVVHQQYVLYNGMNLAQMNHAMKTNYATHRARVFKGIPEAVRFERLLKRHGEDRLAEYHYHLKAGTLRLFFGESGFTGASKVAVATLTRDVDGETRDTISAMDGTPRRSGLYAYRSELAELHKMAFDRNYWALTRVGIENRWHFVGVLRSTMDPDRFRGRQQFGYGRVLSTNVTTKGVFLGCKQVWGKLSGQSKVFFVLTRTEIKGDPGPFQIHPYGQPERCSVPMSLLTYRDITGSLCFGQATFVGTVNLPPNKTSDVATRQIAAGIVSSTPHQAREAGATLVSHKGMMRLLIRSWH